MFGEELELQVVLKNGSTGGPGSAESIRLFALERQMMPLQIPDSGPFRGSFKLSKINAPDGLPVLLQVTYNGVNYNKMIPPVPMLRTRPQEVIVYDKTPDRSVIKTKSLLHLVREKEALVVSKVSILTNNTIPPKSFQNPNDPLEVYIPEGALEINAQLTQSTNQMAIPIPLTKGKNGWVIDRAILPGTSQLIVNYMIPSTNLSPTQFKDKLLFENREGEKVVFSKPKDMQVSFIGQKGIRPVPVDAPPDVTSNIVSYAGPQYEITLSVIGGEPIQETANQEREINNGSIFVSTEKTIYGVIGVLSFLFFLSFTITYRIRKE
ncbi:hypothetical protein EHQ64_19635 [Leptospira sarikeiensis]|uniref:Uncharacterized protein n=1 Tax=Leptospira sarikeiensis TaxID=2484943 RepID=A0A4R9JYT9_9LEPT|nr:hypothetical protein EHQ64_19635 [Leptospira sarikeiensis]